MSAVWANTPASEVAASEGGDARSRDRSRLRAVPAPAVRLSRVPFVLVLIGLFGLGMAGLLMLNTTLQNQAFASQALNQQANALTYQQTALARQVQAADAPQELARRASALGMRANPYPAFIRTSDGKIIGYPEVVGGNEVPWQIVKTPEQVAADAAAAKAAKAAKVAAAKAAAEKAAAAKVAAAKAAQAGKTPPKTTSTAKPPAVKTNTEQQRMQRNEGVAKPTTTQNGG